MFVAVYGLALTSVDCLACWRCWEHTDGLCFVPMGISRLACLLSSPFMFQVYGYDPKFVYPSNP